MRQVILNFHRDGSAKDFYRWLKNFMGIEPEYDDERLIIGIGTQVDTNRRITAGERLTTDMLYSAAERMRGSSFGPQNVSYDLGPQSAIDPSAFISGTTQNRATELAEQIADSLISDVPPAVSYFNRRHQ